MRHHIHADHLMSDARRVMQDPSVILERVGVKEGMTVADLGCGPGFFSIPLATMVGDKGLVYAVDGEPEMLKHLEENIDKSGIQKQRIKIVNADVASTGIPSNSVDLAFFIRLLHDIDDKQAFLDEVKRICKPGAKVVDIDWKKGETEHGPLMEIRLNEEESEKILSDDGFKLVKQFDAGKDHYGLIFEPSN